jgi:uncharacterized protein with von Willebrand factor type A (vWA) domain
MKTQIVQNFDVKYFKLENESADQDSIVCAQIETQMTRERYEEITGITQATTYSNKGKHLMLFNDQSCSMSGTPFETLK